MRHAKQHTASQRRRTRWPHALVLTGAALLAACGGGGSDAPPTVALSAVTAANQDAVAAGVMRSAFSGAALGGALPLGSRSRPLGEAAATLPGAAPAAWMRTAASASMALLQAAESRKRAAAAGPAVRPLAVSTTTTACAVAGTLTLTEDDLGTPNDPVGDTVRATFAGCDEGDGAVLDGGLTLTLASYSVPAPNRIALTAAVAVDGFSETRAGGSGTQVRGAATLSMALETDTAGAVTLDIVFTATDPGLTLATTNPAGSTTLLPGLAIGLATGIDAGGAERPLQTRVDGPIGVGADRFQVRTVSPFLTAPSDAYPGQGRLVVDGAAGSRLQVTAISPTTARLELDADGDGGFEATKDVAWSALVP